MLLLNNSVLVLVPPTFVLKQEAFPDPPWVRMVYAVFAMNTDNQLAMQRRLYDSYVQTYERTLRNLIRSLGCKNIYGVRLSNPTEIVALQKEAQQWSTSITNTYNGWLSGAINKTLDEYRETHNGTLRGMNRRTLASRVRSKIRNYWYGRRGPDQEGGIRTWIMGKLTSIAVTEQTRAIAMATTAFQQYSNLQSMEMRVSPGSAVCQTCNDLIALGWMKAEQAKNVVLPVHPSCPHGYETRLGNRDELRCDDLWKGN